MNKFKINTDFITLGQFLKATDHIGSGGEAKFFLVENDRKLPFYYKFRVIGLDSP